MSAGVHSAFLLFFAYFVFHILCAFFSLLCYQFSEGHKSSPDHEMVQIENGYPLQPAEEKSSVSGY